MARKCKILGIEFNSHEEARDYFGVSKSLISLVLSGKRDVSSKMALKAGYKKVKTVSVTYVKINEGK